MSVVRTRRRFMTELTGSTLLLPTATGWAGQDPSTTAALAEEDFWNAVRQQFAFEETRVPLNAANPCPSPRVVADRVAALTRDIDRDCSSQNRRRFPELLEASRTKVAAALRVSSDEIALVRNTSEANNIINNGLPFGSGDEVVIWDQNHPTNNVAWDVRATRFGGTVTRVSTPQHPTGVHELVSAFERALTPRTTVLALTETSNVSGVHLPIAELCDISHRRGIHVHVDGAQAWGVHDINLQSLGCDSFSASAHKWLLGPREVGLLYVKAEQIERIWPSVIAPSWGSDVTPRPVGARRFESMGQRDDAALSAISTTIKFLDGLGIDRIETRVTRLATRLKTGLIEAGYTLVTPLDTALSGGVCIAQVEGDRNQLVDRLYHDHGIAGAATGGLRLCPHLYNTTEHVDRAIRGARALRTTV